MNAKKSKPAKTPAKTDPLAEGRAAFKRGEEPPKSAAGQRGWYETEAEGAAALALGRKLCKQLAANAPEW